MTRNDETRSSDQSRRDFLKASAAAGAVLGAAPFVTHGQAVKRVFKIALIGCGGRGNGALSDHMEAIKYLNQKLGWNIEAQVVATGDWFRGKAVGTGKRYGVPESQCFGGADCYKKVIEAGPDIILMAQPPVFRPVHFEAAIKAGKHVFFEKPSAVDPPGVRRVIAAGELARQKGLSVVAGTQRRHEAGYNRRAIEIKDGAYGRILGGRVSWCQGSIFTNTPVNPKGPDQLCGPWQIWVEMSGDHICEQHVHNIDIANWFLGTHPVAAVGFGYRIKRVAGNMYDFFSVDLEYPGNVHIHSMCRQQDKCWTSVGETFTFEKNKPGDFKPQTPDPYEAVGYHSSGYVSEHAHLLWSIITEKPINEAQNVAWATAAAILGREAAYSGQRITWEEMFEKPDKKSRWYELQLRPSAEDFETGQIVLPKDGDIRYPGKEA